MSTVINFNGRKCIEPGSYSVMRYTPHSVVNVSEFGNVMIIDTGLSVKDGVLNNTEFAGGGGINSSSQGGGGIKSVYSFENITDFEAFMGGGLITDIARKIFTPRDGVNGAPKLFYARAATTVGAVLNIASNSITLTCKNEGVVGNAVYYTNGGINKLQRGYDCEIVQGVIDTTKFKAVLKKGTYAGTDKDGEAYNGIAYGENCEPIILYESSEFSTTDELYNEMVNNPNIISEFNVELVNTTNLAVESLQQSSGGTTTFSSSDYQQVLDAIEELDITFFLCTNLTISDATNAANNALLFTWLKTKAKYNEFMFVPAGADKNELFNAVISSKSVARYYNSNQVVAIHGNPIVPRRDRNGTKKLYPIYLAASIIGLNAGASPQTPLTFKRVGYESFEYDLTPNEREEALKYGIIHVRNINGYWCVNQGVNTIQYPDNLQTLNQRGESFELSVELIKAQMSKEITMDAQSRFTGLTAAQADPASVKAFTETKLNSFIAQKGDDNLIIRWKNVVVTANNGDYTIYYDFVPNVPVNKTFFIGNMLDFSI